MKNIKTFKNFINEANNSLGEELDSIYRKTRTSDFYKYWMGDWEDWSFNDELEPEVTLAIKEIGAPFDKIFYFDDEQSKTAYDDFNKELRKSKLIFKEGTYFRGRRRFVIVINE